MRRRLWRRCGKVVARRGHTFEQVDVLVRVGMTLGRGGGSEALSGSEAFFFGDKLWIGFTDGEVVGFTGVVLETAILI